MRFSRNWGLPILPLPVAIFDPMEPFYQGSVEASSVAPLIVYLLGWLFLWFVPLLIFGGVIYLLISLPLRRQERARMAVDLIETGLARGRGVEDTIISASASRDPAPGVRFHLLAAHLENGVRLSEALNHVPRLLPPSLTAMLKVGERIGDVGKVLPACRLMLKDANSQVWKAPSYLFVLILLGAPVAFVLLRLMAIFVWPKYEEMAAEMGSIPLNRGGALLMEHWAVSAVLLIVPAVLYLAAVLYVGGPRLIAWVQAGLPQFCDALFYRIPWWRKRIQRDFSAMLALLLDAGVPEEQAVSLGAESTANASIQARARRVVSELQAGRPLTAALDQLDETGEFRWRLANAVHHSGGFAVALRGWQESLDATAFQQEQAASQTITTLLVLINGFIVGLVAITVFQLLISMVWEGALW